VGIDALAPQVAAALSSLSMPRANDAQNENHSSGVDTDQAALLT
jgi:hypothetical protein